MVVIGILIALQIKNKGSGTFAPDFSINYGDPRPLPIKIEGSGMASYIGRCNVVLEWCSFGLGSTTDIITGIITAANADGAFNEDEYCLIFNLLPEAGINIESAL